MNFPMGEQPKAQIKSAIITITQNKVVEARFQNTDPTNPITIPELNRIIAALKSEHQKYLRVFRTNQRLVQMGQKALVSKE